MTRQEQENLALRLKESGWGILPPEHHLADLPPGFMMKWDLCSPYTMISPERGWALAEAVRHVCESAIPGDIVECGVWKGGACLLVSLVLDGLSAAGDRMIWMYDTFEGMPNPGSEDRIAHSGQPLSERDARGWWASGKDEVKATLDKSPLPPERFRLVEGRVEETLKASVPESISVLRLDTDWYESTLAELEILYPRLSPGGILIIDDYGHFTGARKAVDEYFASIGKPVLLHRSDYTGRVIVKD